MIRSGYSFVAVGVKVLKYNKTRDVRLLRKPVSFVFPRVPMFSETNQDSSETKLTVSLADLTLSV